jgi:transposase-like protein
MADANQTPLTQQEYLQDSNRCPFCRSASIFGVNSLDAEGGAAWQTIGCHDCDRRWQDMYKMTGYEEVKK